MQSIDITEVLSRSIRNRTLFLSMFAPIILVGFASFLDRTFIADTVLLRNDYDASQSVSGGLFQNLQGFADVAGLDLGGQSQKSIAHTKMLTSKHFVLHFIEKHGLAKEVMPNRWNAELKEWNPESGIRWFKYTQPIDSVESNNSALANAPSANLLYEEFMKEHLSVREDKFGVISISVTWHDPILAANICNTFVRDANEYIRDIDVRNLNLNLRELEKQYNSARIEQLKGLISSLMAEQIKNIALAKSQPEYAFIVIDAALPSFKINTPSFVGIFIVSGILGFLIVLAISFMLIARSKNNHE